MNALVEYAGMMPSLAAVETGKKLALANKESLVIAGKQIIEAADRNGAAILPVDSEHSAIFQSLVGEVSPARRLILTASGGPFLHTPKERLCEVTVEQALRHPNWSMGAKITVDSSTMVNKGFEVIEAHWLFGLPAEKIDVLVHPQSVVHSMVEFADGAIKAQLGTPDMRLPIQYAFSFPKRLSLNGDRLDLFRQPLEFFEPDTEKFRCLAMAYEAISKGGNMPCILNAANEIVNEGFRNGACSFLEMGEIIEKTMSKVSFDKSPDLDVYLQTDAESRKVAQELMSGR